MAINIYDQALDSAINFALINEIPIAINFLESCAIKKDSLEKIRNILEDTRSLQKNQEEVAKSMKQKTLEVLRLSGELKPEVENFIPEIIPQDTLKRIINAVTNGKLRDALELLGKCNFAKESEERVRNILEILDILCRQGEKKLEMELLEKITKRIAEVVATPFFYPEFRKDRSNKSLRPITSDAISVLVYLAVSQERKAIFDLLNQGDLTENSFKQIADILMLVVPLNRKIFGEEYEKIAGRINLSIEPVPRYNTVLNALKKPQEPRICPKEIVFPPDIISCIFSACLTNCGINELRTISCLNQYWRGCISSCVDQTYASVEDRLRILDAEAILKSNGPLGRDLGYHLIKDEPPINMAKLKLLVCALAFKVIKNGKLTLLTVPKNFYLMNLCADKKTIRFHPLGRLGSNLENPWYATTPKSYRALIPTTFFKTREVSFEKGENISALEELKEFTSQFGCDVPTMQESILLCIATAQIYGEYLYKMSGAVTDTFFYSEGKKFLIGVKGENPNTVKALNHFFHETCSVQCSNFSDSDPAEVIKSAVGVIRLY